MKTEEVEALAKVYDEAHAHGNAMVSEGELHRVGVEAVARAVRAQDAARGGTLTEKTFGRMENRFRIPEDFEALKAHSAAQGRTIAALDEKWRGACERQAASYERRKNAERERDEARAELAKTQAERDRLSEHVKATIGGPFDPRVVLLSGGLNLPEWEARARRAESALHQCVSALDGLLGDSDGPDDDRPGVKAMQAAMAALNATTAEHPDTAHSIDADVAQLSTCVAEAHNRAALERLRVAALANCARGEHPDTATLRAIYERLDAWYDGRVPAEVLRSEKATWRCLRGDSGPSGGGGRKCWAPDHINCPCTFDPPGGCRYPMPESAGEPTTPQDVVTGEHLDGCIEVETSPNSTGWSCDSGCPANPLNFERSRRSAASEGGDGFSPEYCAAQNDALNEPTPPDVAASEPKPTPDEDWRTVDDALFLLYGRDSLNACFAALARLKADPRRAAEAMRERCAETAETQRGEAVEDAIAARGAGREDLAQCYDREAKSAKQIRDNIRALPLD